MPLPTVKLDDRTFQDIVDEAKRRIPRYCPEWTDHNVSDPGIMLVELFAWMTEMLLYRVNQVPDKMYVKFLELIGVRLQPPSAARAPITFYLSAPQPAVVTIPAGTEVGTVRVGGDPAVVFTTESDLIIQPPALIGTYTRDADRGSGSDWIEHDLGRVDLPNQAVALFSPEPNAPTPDDAFYLAFERDLSRHVVALALECEAAGGAGVFPERPPVVWEAWSATKGWQRCEVEVDGTKGFNKAGTVLLRLPSMSYRKDYPVDGFLLRCRLTLPEDGAAMYSRSPVVHRLSAQSRGGTVDALHAVTVRNEVLGRSDGTPGQSFKLRHAPVLARDLAQDYLVVDTPDGLTEHWTEVEHFGASGPKDPCYTLDSIDGKIALGPELLRPRGRHDDHDPETRVYRFGKVPPAGSVLRFSRYQHGGGGDGNVQKGTLVVPRASIPYVSKVTNHESAMGGRDAQSLEDAKLRAPQTLRTQARAVTSDDFETLARQVRGVARASCFAPGAQPGTPGEPRPGEVELIILPQVDSPAGRIAAELLKPSAELISAVSAHLDRHRLLGTRLTVRGPDFVWVSVEAKIHVASGGDGPLVRELRRLAEDALYRYVNPYVGGPDGRGWPLGRVLHVAELYALLQGLRDAGPIEFVEDLRMFVSAPGGGVARTEARTRVDVPVTGLLCSDVHVVNRT
jgi:predicted phage baseplate assembly protein